MTQTGRPCKLTPQVQENIAACISAGVPCRTAAGAVGVNASTFYRWLTKGREATTGEFHDFYDRIEKAKAEAITLGHRTMTRRDRVITAQQFRLMDKAGRCRAQLGLDQENGQPSLYLFDKAGTKRASLHLSSDGEPRLALLDKQGKPLLSAP